MKVFPPALLGRIVAIPYYPLSDDDARQRSSACSSAASRSASRATHKIPFTYDDDVVKLIASRCTELESGGRMIDAILTNTLLPTISREFLARMMEGRPVDRVHITVADGDFRYGFE